MKQLRVDGIEHRWPVVLTIACVFVLLSIIPKPMRVFPQWFLYVATFLTLAATISVPLSRASRLWIRIERVVFLLFFATAAAGTTSSLVGLVGDMAWRRRELSGVGLLSTSISLWIINILAFSLLYWQLDRGGPDARAGKAIRLPDWRFTQDGAPEATSPTWRPTFVDYLFLSFTAASAFSPADALPLTSRAKLLMMVESTYSLITILLVASRAVSLLSA